VSEKALTEIGEFLLGLAVWCGFIFVFMEMSGGSRFAAVTALIGVGAFAISKMIPRYVTWRADRQPCPHGIAGGLRFELCPVCVEDKRLQQSLHHVKLEVEAEQKRIRFAAERD
jgi:hypothetical protein